MSSVSWSATKRVDCATCPVRGLRCEDCVVTALGPVPHVAGEGLPLDANEARAVDLLLRTGLVSRSAAATAVAHRERLTLYSAAG